MGMPPNHPCTRDCPERKPGCFCSRKAEWDAKRQEAKDARYKEKQLESAVGAIRNPPRAQKRRERNRCM